jgi:hypothetical protein
MSEVAVDSEGPGTKEGCVIEENPEAIEAWRRQVVGLLRGILVGVERLVAASELSGKGEPASAHMEIPAEEKTYPTWILTDATVARLEEAIAQEQRVRGQAYGG